MSARETLPQRCDSEKAAEQGAGAVLCPLSFAQQRLWFLDRLQPGSATYNVPQAWRIEGAVDIPALQKAFDALVDRHEILRATFGSRDGQPVQIIHAARPCLVNVADVSNVSENDGALQRLCNEEARRPFDLRHGPLIRVQLFRVAPSEHILLVVLHHIIADAWSFDVLRREIAIFYEGFVAGRLASLPELPIQFPDFAAWQREQAGTEQFRQHLDFWKSRLAAEIPPLDLPTDHAASSDSPATGRSEPFEISETLTASLRKIGQREGATLFMVLLAAFKTFLHRITEQDDIVVGVPLSGRDRIETEGLIGFFVNTLALRTSVAGNPSFVELLGRVRESTLSSFAHQEMPFEELVRTLQPERAPGRNPLFNVALALHGGFPQSWSFAGLRASLMDVDTATAKFDWSLLLEEGPRGIKGRLEFNELFEPSAIRRVLRRFRTLLEGIAEDPFLPISKLPLLNEIERRQVVTEWNNTATDYERDACVHRLFENQAARTPEAVALTFGGARMTYDELNRRANQLANRLQRSGVGPDTLVGVNVERSFEMIIALLATLKAGGAYVPLDPSNPAARLQFMVRDTGLRIIIADRDLNVASAAPFQPAIIRLDHDAKLLSEESDENPVSDTTAESLAYVIYTSGSTGEPKGAAIPHRAVVRLVRNTNYVEFSTSDVFMQLATTSFDASTFEIWGSLLNGARLDIFPPGIPSLEELGRFIRDNRVTTLWLTAGLFHQMVDHQLENLRSVRQLLAGGDVLSTPHVLKALRELPGCRLINGYGPTENTTFTCCHRVPPDWQGGRSVPIGAPISNTRVYIVDANLNPVPVGIPGELCVGGDGLARGYLNRPELMAEKFVPNPFAAGPREKLYRTGDRARWLPDGTIEFLGRRDQQVKVRGYRVEPGEIEAVLAMETSVREASVVLRDDANRDLVAYVTLKPGAAWNESALREFLASRLPPFMIPVFFVRLDQLPLTMNGKVDRRALPAPSVELRGTVTEPRTAGEERLLAIWKAVLGRDSFGVHDNFFELGGHSLLATQMISRIAREFGIELPVRAVFETPTVAGLAARIDSDGKPRPGGAGETIARRIQPSEARQLLAQLEKLSEAEIESLLHTTGHTTP